MIVNDGFMLRETGADKYIVATGARAGKFRRIVRVNTSAGIIFTGFKNGESAEQIALKLTRQFKVDMEKALSDVDICARKLACAGVMKV